MGVEIKLSSKGQVVIPKEMRDALGLKPGQSLDVTRAGGGILLRPTGAKSGRSFEEITANIRALVRYDGPPVSVEEMNRAIAEGWADAARRSDRARD